MRRPGLIAATLLVSASFATPAAEPADLDDGRSIYLTGAMHDGSPVRARVHADVTLPPRAAACVNCHRRSGLGISEGGARSLNLTAPSLFAESRTPPYRPAYDDGTLIRAIVDGVAPDGRELHPNMPRYSFDAGQAAAILAYLKTLGSELPDGVGDAELVIATIISDSAPPAQQAAVEQVLHRYVEDKNGLTRRDADRAAAAHHAYGRSRQRAFRMWDLRTWRLQGKPTSWPRQLRRLYESDRPFAIVSGTAGNDWQVVHDFCEQEAIPCLLPLADAPANADDSFYNLYLSRGADLELDVLSDQLNAIQRPDALSLAIVTENRDDQDAVAALRSRLDPEVVGPVRHYVLRNDDDGRRLYRKLAEDGGADILVPLLSARRIEDLLGAWPADLARPTQIRTSQSWTDWLAGGAHSPSSAAAIRHVFPYSLPASLEQKYPREYLWLRDQGLLDVNRIDAIKVLYACRVLGMGLADIQNNFSREYLLEVLEHALDGTQLTSLYPRTSLGPDQRLLSRGAYEVSLNPGGSPPFTNAVWVQP